MAQPEMSTRATRASYAADRTWEDIAGILGDLGAAPPLSRLSNLAMVLHTTSSALRCDFIEDKKGEPLLSLVRLGANPPWLVDHRSKNYRILQLRGPIRDAANTKETAAEATQFGPALRLTFYLPAEAELHVWVLQTPSFASLASWWHAFFPGIVPRRHHGRFPFKYELRLRSGGESIARVELRSLHDITLPLSFFRPPKEYNLEQGETESRDIPVPKGGTPTESKSLARESAIAALLGGASDEQVKLQMRDEVFERVRKAVNDVSQRLDTFAGEGLQIDLQPLFGYLSVPTASTPAGMGTIADRLLYRALFWHFGSRLKKIFMIDALRDALLKVIDALSSMDSSAGTIDPATSTPIEDRDLFRKTRDLIVAQSSSFLPLLKNIRDADVGPIRQIDILTLEPWDPSDSRVNIARAWFNLEFRFLSLQPEIGLRQRSGRNQGWLQNSYIADGLGDLIDLHLDINSVTLDFARQAALGPTQLLDDTDPRFQQIDAFEQNPAPGIRKRAGFSTSLHLDRLVVTADLSTTPTTNSLAVAALILFQPQEFLKLWNFVHVNIELRTLSADVLIYFEQERLSPGGPALKVWVGPIEAALLSVSGVALSGDPFIALLGNLVVNHLVDFFSLALIDRLRQEYDGVFAKLSNFLQESVGGFFPETETRTPRTSGSFTQTAQEALSKGFSLRENIRLQHMLNLNREEEFERLTENVNQTQSKWREAFGHLDELWTQHKNAADDAGVPAPPEGFNPQLMPKPINNKDGAEISAAQVAVLQMTYDAWAAQRRVVNSLDLEVRQVGQALDEFLDNWPEGQTACEVVGEPDGYRVGLAVCRPGAPATGRALVHPPIGAGQSGDLTLLISARTFREMTASAGFAYRGDVRNTDGSPAVLPQLPPIDWWRDAPEPSRLGPKPNDLRDGPPDIVLDPSAGSAEDWRGYWSVIEVAGGSAQLISIRNPAPNEHVAEILVTVTVMAGLTTYTPVLVERCGPDLTKLIGELERPRFGDLGRLPVGPDEPRPRPDRPIGIEVEAGFQRVPAALEPLIITANTLEKTRVRFVTDAGNTSLFDIEGAQLYRPGFVGGFAGDAHCRVVTAWDVKDREVWLNARLELRLPVFLGFGNTGPFDGKPLPGAKLVGARAHLPILTYCFRTDPISTGPFTLQTAGPLTGLAQGGNRTWIEGLMMKHALALAKNSTDRHRDNPPRYAYGVAYGLSGGLLQLQPEGFVPYTFLAMHPTHWSSVVPPAVTDSPPFLAMETFGSNPNALSLAINLFVVESLLDKLAM
jgi:hypothetical protein